MVAEEGGVLVFHQELCRADVCRQHTFFNQLVGIVADHRYDFFDLAVVVEKHLGFNAFKLHRAAFEAFFLKDFEEFVEGVDLGFVRMVEVRPLSSMAGLEV